MIWPVSLPSPAEVSEAQPFLSTCRSDCGSIVGTEGSSRPCSPPLAAAAAQDEVRAQRTVAAGTAIGQAQRRTEVTLAGGLRAWTA